ncbi:MAG TPA: M20/M25/M40 family metallo-hydrolase, partial [Candidatus Binatia bacterium]|nr:M20/M25/M40 family metallo-hydrolase [Candidatus Binatia bacterium]
MRSSPKRVFLFLASSLFYFFALISAWPAEPDWAAVEKEAGELLSLYLRIDTTNPPGNELAAANFWKQRLAQEGLEARVFEPQAGRGVVYARLKGAGEKKALILLHHLDVVPAVKTDWQVDPFAGTVKDGYVYGRGAIDCKGVAATQFMTLALLKRLGLPLKRDIIFLGTADEEEGGRQGAGWFVANHFDLIADAEFLLTEGGGIRVRDGKRSYYVDIAEKAPCWIQLEASGPAGHGSRPLPETAVTRLLRALDKILHYETAVKIIPAVQAYFTALAAQEEPAKAERLRDLERALTDPTFRQDFLANPTYNALVRNTISPTVLEGSNKTNVIPAHARAQLDCRLLPGEDPQQFVAHLKKVVDDPEVQFSILLNFPPLASEA